MWYLMAISPEETWVLKEGDCSYEEALKFLRGKGKIVAVVL